MSETTPSAPSPICFRCRKTPNQIPEYIEMAEIYRDMTPDDYVREEEGTYNREANTFCCTECYCAIGMPASPRGWKAPNVG